jgi:hypothetical protein
MTEAQASARRPAEAAASSGPMGWPAGASGWPADGSGSGAPESAASGQASRQVRAADLLPSVTDPKGGGAIRGLGEKFSVNAATGTATMAVPLPLSPGRSGFTPDLRLSYDSGAGNGPFGFGWGLGPPAITRKTDKGLPRYCDDDESDAFILAGTGKLMAFAPATAGARRAISRRKS